MNYIWALMTKVNDMIKPLPQDLNKDAAITLKNPQEKAPEGTRLETVLEARSSTPTALPTPRRQMTETTKMSSKTDPTLHQTTVLHHKTLTLTVSHQTSNSGSLPGTSEGSTPIGVYS